MGASLFSLGCAPYVANGSTYVPVELFDALLGNREGAVALEGNTVKLNTDATHAAQIPNPFTGHATLEEAAKAAGFDLAVPEQINGNPRRDIQTMDGGMIQVFYGGDDCSVCVRKAPGSEDISGDYNVYPQVMAVDVDGIGVTMKGRDGLVHLAVWTNGGYTYALSTQTGLDSASMAALVPLIK